MYRNCLMAFSSLELFTTGFSLGVHPEQERLIIPRRDWAQVYLGFDLVYSFSHYPEPERRDTPFERLLEWPAETSAGVILGWSPEDWKALILDRIHTRSNERRLAAEAAITEQINAKTLACSAITVASLQR